MVEGSRQAGAFRIALTDERVADLAFLLREELGDSLSEGTPLNELKHAIITILRAAGFAANAVVDGHQPASDRGGVLRLPGGVSLAVPDHLP